MFESDNNFVTNTFLFGSKKFVNALNNPFLLGSIAFATPFLFGSNVFDDDLKISY